ncbi:uncharacterized protein LAESUDRAFT_812784 [Laetiporus sulphureus 93-53]|uniref:RRM domain-containing protein n=1 Tax=Laetiporus sulphureus 93-53 TaxID=1314785 RepID=A0A165E9G1_9APHY|nr:uncharacterized protein LAESUDRAFT_812784 [Laetiporus sulphureus 93-53]KZT06526.1 hypothetical protein LAESUDRAFT_812784 [Laetiporus sulphureus 93-53]
MSRPDAHLYEYEQPPFDGRGYGQYIGHGSGPSLRVRHSISPPDFVRRDLLAHSFYSTPPLAVDRRTLTSSTQNANGFSPRLYNSLPAGRDGDSWSIKPAPLSATPTANKQDSGSAVPQLQPPLSSFVHHHHSPSPPRAPSVTELYSSSVLPPPPAFNERDLRDSRGFYIGHRHLQQQSSSPVQVPHAQPPPPSIPSPTNGTSSSRCTLWWSDLEPWMDEEYAKQVCNLMGWDPVNIKVPRPAPDPITGQQANNPGYCFLTFPTQAHATSVLSQINNGNGASMIMPNSNKPFTLNWASSIPTAPAPPVLPGQTVMIPSGQNPQYPKEYSIFVGDLAPEVSNSDLVAVFRNPVLGLRNDREPRFIRPFLSCKSAKIMLDPVTGVSRGYGFVRFTDEADQQRALIEMHGLYCLSRPMRISPATAKFKPPPGMNGLDFSQMPFPVVSSSSPVLPDQQSQMTIALTLPSGNQTKSVSAPLAGPAGASSNGNTVSNSTSNSSLSAPSLSSGSSTASSSSTLASTTSDDAIKAAQYAGAASTASPGPVNSSGAPSVSVPFALSSQEAAIAQKYNIPEESWKHHAQARAILSNLIGPNGEQLTSSDPYNTTVFVGGLSPLISEETLRTFFAPFGDIHYVKVPVGKHCGFVQFVRKPDAERAIEKMQGFPIGGSRIRLSWGRSQYKAAQAAAQAAQAAAFQAQYQAQVSAAQNTTSMTPEQALQLLQKFGLTNLLNGNVSLGNGGDNESHTAALPEMNGDRANGLNSINCTAGQRLPPPTSSFSPFSPDPNYLGDGLKMLDQTASGQGQVFGNVPKGYPPWYNPASDEKYATGGKASPAGLQTIRPPSVSQRFNSMLGEVVSSSHLPFQQSRASSRQETPIPRADVSRRGSHDQYGAHEQEQDPIHDLNGTLASLELNSPAMWKGGDAVHTLPSSP